MVVSAEDARRLIWIVARDRELPRYVRSEANSLEASVPISPELVHLRLNRLRERVLPDLGVDSPTVDYARCVSIDVFYQHHLRPARRSLFQDPDDYLYYLEDTPDPAGVAQSELREDSILVPAAHSWLIPADHIAGLGGAMIKSRLRIRQDPPYIVMVFPVERMEKADVGVREPCGLDAVPGSFTWWSPRDVPDERIDEDIPLSALGSLEWRP